MRIAIFTSTYAPVIDQGSDMVSRLVAHARSLGHEVLLADRHAPIHADGVTTPPAGNRIALATPQEPLTLRRMDQHGQAALASFAPDLVHVTTAAALGWAGRRWALNLGVPLVTSFTNALPSALAQSDSEAFERPLWQGLRTFHRPASLTLCSNPAVLETLQHRGFHPRLRIWRRGMDTELFSPKRCDSALRKRIVGDARSVLLYSGRLTAENGLELLMRTWPQIQALVPNSALVIVGDGPLRRNLQSSAPEGVHFTGHQTGMALAETYGVGDVFALPSATQAQGNRLVEAMATGLPVVAPSPGSATDLVIPGRSGVLVPPRDPRQFVTACVELLRDSEARIALGRGARHLALKLRWSAALDRLLATYEDARDEARSSRGLGPDILRSDSGTASFAR